MECQVDYRAMVRRQAGDSLANLRVHCIAVDGFGHLQFDFRNVVQRFGVVAAVARKDVPNVRHPMLTAARYSLARRHTTIIVSLMTSPTRWMRPVTRRLKRNRRS